MPSPASFRSDRPSSVGQARSAKIQVRRVGRLGAAALALLLAVALGTSIGSWTRIAALRDEMHPALADVRQLGAVLVAAHDALHLADAPALARADSLADRFHRVADTARRRPLLHDVAPAVDREFRLYYSEARRRALNHHVDPLAERLAEMAVRDLGARLDAIGAAQRRSIDEAYQSLQQFQVASGIAMVLLVLAALVLLASRATDAVRAISTPVEAAARRAQMLADGDLDAPLRPAMALEVGDADAEEALDRALSRIAAVARANRTAAEELAAGEYRIGTHDDIPVDRTGRALARTSAYLDYLSIAAQRVSEGDLTVAIEPRSPDDTLGHAQAMMLQRVVSLVHDAHTAAQLIAQKAEGVKRAAIELQPAAGADAAGPRLTKVPAVKALAASADALGGHAQRLAAMLAELQQRGPSDDRETRPTSRHLSLHKTSISSAHRRSAHRLALV